MNELAIFQPAVTRGQFLVTPAAEQAQMQLLSMATEVVEVNNAEQQGEAVEVQTRIREHVNAVEKCRKEMKEPILQAGKALDAAAAAHVTELKAEELRLARLNGDYVEHQRILAQAEINRQQAELARIERERAEALAKTKTVAQADAVMETFSQKAAEVAPAPAIVKAEGQRVREDWDIQVVDIHKLYRANPNCCELKPRLSEIRQLLAMGVVPPGVTAKKIILSGVTTRRGTTIDV